MEEQKRVAGFPNTGQTQDDEHSTTGDGHPGRRGSTTGDGKGSRRGSTTGDGHPPRK
ncbi:MAG TPA: hypothetical protein VH186_38690 [Chloroflexia bacterium]|nr:hypothetical protein [Chloroflexia bacterium]